MQNLIKFRLIVFCPPPHKAEQEWRLTEAEDAIKALQVIGKASPTEITHAALAILERLTNS
jgi:hypothetical protein